MTAFSESVAAAEAELEVSADIERPPYWVPVPRFYREYTEVLQAVADGTGDPVLMDAIAAAGDGPEAVVGMLTLPVNEFDFVSAPLPSRLAAPVVLEEMDVVEDPHILQALASLHRPWLQFESRFEPSFVAGRSDNNPIYEHDATTHNPIEVW